MQTIKTVTEEEFQKILRRIRHEANTPYTQRIADRDESILTLCFDAGLRISEALSLTWEMCFVNAIPVTSLVLRPRMCKSGYGRTVPLTSRTRDLLSKWLLRIGCPPADTLSGFVFAGSSPKIPLSPRSVQIMLKRASKEQLGRVVTPHCLRHSFATRMMKVADMRTVQILLGHCSLRSTQVYTHPDSHDMQNAISAMEAADKKPPRPPL